MEKNIYPPNKDINIRAYHLNIFREVRYHLKEGMCVCVWEREKENEVIVMC
jgi:hypothetical protein